jgi:hypothetical protein
MGLQAQPVQVGNAPTQNEQRTEDPATHEQYMSHVSSILSVEIRLQYRRRMFHDALAQRKRDVSSILLDRLA